MLQIKAFPPFFAQSVKQRANKRWSHIPPACMTCNPACSIDPHHPIPFCARGINHRHSMQRKFHGVSTLSPLLLTIQTGERRASANTAACLQKKQPKQGKTTLYGMCALVPWHGAAFFQAQIWIYLQFGSGDPGSNSGSNAFWMENHCDVLLPKWNSHSFYNQIFLCPVIKSLALNRSSLTVPVKKKYKGVKQRCEICPDQVTFAPFGLHAFYWRVGADLTRFNRSLFLNALLEFIFGPLNHTKGQRDFFPDCPIAKWKQSWSDLF